MNDIVEVGVQKCKIKALKIKQPQLLLFWQRELIHKKLEQDPLQHPHLHTHTSKHRQMMAWNDCFWPPPDPGHFIGVIFKNDFYAVSDTLNLFYRIICLFHIFKAGHISDLQYMHTRIHEINWREL